MGLGRFLAAVAAGAVAVVAAPVVLPAAAAVGAAGAVAAAGAAASVGAAAATAAAGAGALATGAATAVGGAVAAAGTAAASTAVGGAVVSAATAVGGAATALGTAAASSAVGTAVTGTMGAIGTGIGAVAGAAEAVPVIGGVAANIAGVTGTAAGATAVGTIATTGAVGTANAVSGVNKRIKASDIKQEAMSDYHEERGKLEKTQNSTNKKLEELGELKVKAWGEGYPRFCEMYSKVKLPPNSKGEVALEGNLSLTPEDLREIKALGIGIKEAVQTGAAGYVAGSLVGLAAQSGAASMAVFASTGTAISSLSGAAATNATLAQLGGGALGSSAGALGVAGGKAVMTGLTAAPLLMVEGILFNVKGNKVLDSAYDIKWEADKAVGTMKSMESELRKLSRLSQKVQDELQQLYDVYLRLIVQAERTVERTTEYINFTAAEKMNFQKTCLAIKLISVLSKQDLLDKAKEGEMNKVLDKETKATLQTVQQAAENGKLLME